MAISASFSIISKTHHPKFPIFNHLLKTPPPSLQTRLNFIPNNLNPPPISLLFTSRPLTSTPLSKQPPRGRLQIRSLFTGIVEEMGQIENLGFAQDGGFDMTISASTVLGGVHLGDSISVNGTCLTVTQFDNSVFTAGLAPETLRKTSLIELDKGSFVNLERAVTPDTRMGGHFVQGHVDGTGEIVEMEVEEDSLWVKVKTSPEVLK